MIRFLHNIDNIRAKRQELYFRRIPVSQLPTQYPEIYISDEILYILKSRPNLPSKPRDPKDGVLPIKPSKFPKIKFFLQGLLICGIGLFITFLIICSIKLTELTSLFVMLFLCGFVYFCCKSIQSLLTGRTFEFRMQQYNIAIQEHKRKCELFEKELKAYEHELFKFNKLSEEIKTQEQYVEFIQNYTLQGLREYLDKNKNKESDDYYFDEQETVRDNVREGRAEVFFKQFLETNKAIIPDGFRFFFRRKVNGFYPDIAVITARGLCIDVEIDEPYVSDTYEPIHYFTAESEDIRNSVMKENNWNVIRFSERQIVCFPKTCLNIILDFEQHVNHLDEYNLPDGFIEKKWTEEEALDMARNKYRDSYYDAPLEQSPSASGFDNVRFYIKGWKVKEARPFTKDEIEAVKDAVVVASHKGNSVEFRMKQGGVSYIPLSKYSTLQSGDKLDISTATLIVYSKDGEKDIFSVFS